MIQDRLLMEFYYMISNIISTFNTDQYFFIYFLAEKFTTYKICHPIHLAQFGTISSVTYQAGKNSGQSTNYQYLLDIELIFWNFLISSNFMFFCRSGSENVRWLLAYGMGTARFGDCDDDPNFGEGTTKMRTVLARRRYYRRFYVRSV